MGSQSSLEACSSMKFLVILALLGCVLAEPEAKADADAWYGGYGLGYRGYGGYGLGYRSHGLGYGGYGGYGSYGGYRSHYIGKRSADSEPEAVAEAEPEADADAWYGGYGLGYRGYGGYGLGYARGYGGYGGYRSHYIGKRSADSEP